MVIHTKSYEVIQSHRRPLKDTEGLGPELENLILFYTFKGIKEYGINAKNFY